MNIFNSLIIILIGIFFSFLVFPKSIQENFSERIRLPFPTYIINLDETQEGKERLPIIQSIFPDAKRFPATYGKILTLHLIMTLF
jgi:hypothetical protein